MQKKAAAALRGNPLELTLDDLKTVTAIGIYKKNAGGKICVVAKADYPFFLWGPGGVKYEFLDGDFIIVDEDKKVTGIAASRFPNSYSEFRLPTFLDAVEFVPSPTNGKDAGV